VWSEIGSVFITGGDRENFLSSSKEKWDTYQLSSSSILGSYPKYIMQSDR
jgi:hypothetical protein